MQQCSTSWTRTGHAPTGERSANDAGSASDRQGADAAGPGHVPSRAVTAAAAPTSGTFSAKGPRGAPAVGAATAPAATRRNLSFRSARRVPPIRNPRSEPPSRNARSEPPSRNPHSEPPNRNLSLRHSQHRAGTQVTTRAQRTVAWSLTRRGISGQSLGRLRHALFLAVAEGSASLLRERAPNGRQSSKTTPHQ